MSVFKTDKFLDYAAGLVRSTAPKSAVATHRALISESQTKSENTPDELIKIAEAQACGIEVRFKPDAGWFWNAWNVTGGPFATFEAAYLDAHAQLEISNDIEICCECKYRAHKDDLHERDGAYFCDVCLPEYTRRYQGDLW